VHEHIPDEIEWYVPSECKSDFEFEHYFEKVDYVGAWRISKDISHAFVLEINETDEWNSSSKDLPGFILELAKEICAYLREDIPSSQIIAQPLLEFPRFPSPMPA
jgi:hypothetical protein